MLWLWSLNVRHYNDRLRWLLISFAGHICDISTLWLSIRQSKKTFGFHSSQDCDNTLYRIYSTSRADHESTILNICEWRLSLSKVCCNNCNPIPARNTIMHPYFVVQTSLFCYATNAVQISKQSCLDIRNAVMRVEPEFISLVFMCSSLKDDNHQYQ